MIADRWRRQNRKVRLLSAKSEWELAEARTAKAVMLLKIRQIGKYKLVAGFALAGLAVGALSHRSRQSRSQPLSSHIWRLANSALIAWRLVGKDDSSGGHR